MSAPRIRFQHITDCQNLEHDCRVRQRRIPDYLESRVFGGSYEARNRFYNVAAIP